MSPTKQKPSNFGVACYATGLTLNTARKMLEAGEREAARLGVAMSMAISDSGGTLLAFNRMDNAALVTVQISIDKSYTAVLGKMPTLFWKGEYTSGELVPLFFHQRWVTFQGGYPIISGNKILGGIGISGGRLEDSLTARAALKAGGFSTVQADDIIAAELKAARSIKPKQAKRSK
jgi:uncharacterized protein GlcG (DUF336 family)